MKLLSIRQLRGITLALLVQSTVSMLSAASFDQMVVFGDSLSDNGNFSLALGPGVLSNLDYDSRRLTDGPGTTPSTNIVGVAAEQLNGLLGLSPLTPALLGGSNYAWARATTAANSGDLPSGTTPGTGAQVGAYLSTHPQASPGSLYVLWAGANDLFNGNTATDIQNAENAAISQLNAQITALLTAGAKTVIWFNIPDLSLTPAGFLEGPELNNQLHLSSLRFKEDWAASLHSLEMNFPDARVIGVDTYAFIHSLVENPADYGLSNVTTPAQGQSGVNPDQYLFWDTLHPTTKADGLLANYALQQLQAAPVPEAGSGVYIGVLTFGLMLWRIRSAKFRRSR